VVLYVSAGEGGQTATFVAGRRIGSAVARNRARRILRQAWKALADEAGEDLDAVWVARAGIEGAKTQELVIEMRDLLHRAGAGRS
jgi:ribonuclease P protein component